MDYRFTIFPYKFGKLVRPFAVTNDLEASRSQEIMRTFTLFFEANAEKIA